MAVKRRDQPDERISPAIGCPSDGLGPLAHAGRSEAAGRPETHGLTRNVLRIPMTALRVVTTENQVTGTATCEPRG
jgi:hypothetical protein